ncbi:MAG TPA: hypothetical protein VIK71_11095 [Flavobacteriales bacterium]
MASSTNRIFGIEVAYVIALFGMVFYIFLFTIGNKVLSLLAHEEYSLVLDFFPALFLFISGSTLSISLRNNRISKRKLLAYQAKRGSILFLLGLIFCPWWHMNMFVIVGILFFLTQYIARWSELALALLLFSVISLGVILLMLGVPHQIVYTMPQISGSDWHSLFGFLFFNGYFSLLPWSTFYIAGVLFGRLKTSGLGIIPPTSIIGILLIIGALLMDVYLPKFQELTYKVNASENIYLQWRVSYLPFILYGIGLSMVVMNACQYFGKYIEHRGFKKMVQTFSAMKYSILFFQILLTSIILGIANKPTFNSLMLLMIVALVSTFLVFYLASMWRSKINELGPIEFVVKRIAGSGRKG